MHVKHEDRIGWFNKGLQRKLPAEWSNTVAIYIIGFPIVTYHKQNLCGTHWLELNGLELKQAKLPKVVISQEYCNILSVQLLPSNSRHFLPA